ncbi:hypothetical protein QTP88_004184 [Uroleucon formosanum]
MQLNTRFQDTNKLLFLRLADVTKFKEYSCTFPVNALNNLKSTYPNIFYNINSLKVELEVLYNDVKYQNLLHIYDMVKIIEQNALKDILPEAYKLFILILTIPSTSVSNERSFSCLKRIKTCSRNSISQVRFSSLSILSIEKFLINQLKKTESFYDDIINIKYIAVMAEKKQAKINFFFQNLCRVHLFIYILSIYHRHIYLLQKLIHQISYSKSENGAYCKYCVAFAKNEAGVINQKLGALVLKKYDNWRHALEDFKYHSNLDYHKKCMLDADHFLNKLKNPTMSIDKIIDTEKSKQVLQNRKNIIPIIEAGHRDSGKIEIDFSNNEGNFREVLRYTAKCDIEMQAYLEGPGKIKYFSHRSQNDMVDACNKVLLNKVVSKVNAAKCFSILADETADISGIEQVSLCVRYIELNTLTLTEEFLQFVPTSDMTGKGIANLILESLKQFGVDTKYLRGQGYDGAAAMSGKYNGVQAHIREIYPNAIYVHCSAHSLNLGVSKSCSVPEIPLHYLKQKKTLKRSCETRWIKRYHAVHDFLELYEFVEEALEDISMWNDHDTSDKARCLRSCILNVEFILSLVILNKGFALGLALSKCLQTISIDLKEAMALAKNTKQELEEIRINADTYFREIFEQVKLMTAQFDIEIKIPRIAKRQTNRCNIEVDNAETYYRISVFIPYLDKYINELENRFTNHYTTLSSFHSLFKENRYDEDFINLTRQYSEDLEDVGNREEIFKNAMDALSVCNRVMFPNVFKLLQILATLLVLSTSNERSFSTLKRIKTYLRNSTSEGRLNGLAMLSINRHYQITADEVLIELSNKKRHLEFLL